MKKIFTYSIIATIAAVFFSSCAKQRVYDDRSYWLSQESGDVVYSSNYCGVYVVETNYGYTIIENYDGLRTYEGDVMYGNFGGYGSRDFYNYSADIITSGKVLEYDLSYNGALDALDYYCPSGRGGFHMKQSVNALNKMKRTAGVKAE